MDSLSTDGSTGWTDDTPWVFWTVNAVMAATP
jgi:hypothetical protein